MDDIASIQLDGGSRTPLYVQIASAVEDMVRGGVVEPGSRLPATRVLAGALGVNPATVVSAYRFLRDRGLAESRVGSGTYVTRLFMPRSGEFGGVGRFLHLEDRQPQPGLFPVGDIRRLMDHVLDSEGAGAFSYDDIGGFEPLRSELLAYLARCYGIRAEGEGVVVFSGAQQGLSLVLRALISRGDWVLVERPTYPGMLRLLARSGAQVEAVDVMPGGPDVVRLERLLATRPIRLFYTMPVYQNPTGVCYSVEAKKAIFDVCAKHGVVILEDDSLSDLDYGCGRWRPIRACATGGHHCVYLKSFSQLLMPGFRLGFCLAPTSLANALREGKQQTDLLTSGFFQRVLHLFLRHGYLDAHVPSLERHYQPLFSHAHRAVSDELCPLGFQLAPSSGGTSVWLRLPHGMAVDAFVRGCIRREVGVARGELFSLDRSTGDCVAAAFGHIDGSVWDGAVAAMRDVAEGLLG